MSSNPMNKATRQLYTTAFLLSALGLAACSLSDEEPETLGTTVQSISLGSALGVPVYESSTCGMYNGVTPSCTYSNASDITFGWTAPSSGTYRITTTGSSFDTALVIRRYSSPSSQLACRNSWSGTTGEVVFGLALSAGQQILITVDGYASLCGNFKLNITKECQDCYSGPCRTASCSINGQCTVSNSPSGTSCAASDSDPCTEAEVCDGAGHCLATSYTYASCDDGDDCTSGDTCNGGGTCSGTYTCDYNPCAPYGAEYCGGTTCCASGSDCSMYCWNF